MPRTRGAKKSQKVQTAKDEKQPQVIEENQEKQQKEEPEKTKQIVKAKKYKKKTYEEIMRINSSKYQRIFLLEAKRITEEDYWAFTVQGTTGSQYHVRVSTEVKCTCMDFKFKKKPCKHIYFIVTQVAQNQQLLDYFRDKKTISKNAYKLLDDQLTSRLKSRMQKSATDSKDIDLKDDTDCVICFSEMEKETESLQDCGTCKKFFHSQCISTWKTHNPTCPLCRGPLAGGGRDPLHMLKGVQL